MKIQYLGLSCLGIFVFAVILMGPQAYAADDSQYNGPMKAIVVDRTLVEVEMKLNPQAFIIPHASSYYDDLEDHYEQLFLMSDFIGEGIR